jgi:hypothetical protein
MRYARYLLLPALLGIAAFAPAPRAASTLTVTAVYCNNNGGGTFGCYVEVSGGSGTYVNYALRWTERRLGSTNGPYTASGSYWYVTGTCTVGWTLTVTGTVTDSQGTTASGTTNHVCRSAAD